MLEIRIVSINDYYGIGLYPRIFYQFLLHLKKEKVSFIRISIISKGTVRVRISAVPREDLNSVLHKYASSYLTRIVTCKLHCLPYWLLLYIFLTQKAPVPVHQPKIKAVMIRTTWGLTDARR